MPAMATSLEATVASTPGRRRCLSRVFAWLAPYSSAARAELIASLRMKSGSSRMRRYRSLCSESSEPKYDPRRLAEFGSTAVAQGKQCSLDPFRHARNNQS
jgi:hypothetical protein